MKKLLTYTPAEVAEVAGVSRRTVYNWISSGALPAHKVGPKLWVVYRGVLSAYMGGRDPHQAAADIAARLDAGTAGNPTAEVVRPSASGPVPVGSALVSRSRSKVADQKTAPDVARKNAGAKSEKSELARLSDKELIEIRSKALDEFPPDYPTAAKVQARAMAEIEEFAREQEQLSGDELAELLAQISYEDSLYGDSQEVGSPRVRMGAPDRALKPMNVKPKSKGRRS